MNGIELNRLGMQRRILRNLSLRLDVYREPLTQLIYTELRDAIHTAGVNTRGKYYSSMKFSILMAMIAWKDVGIFAMTQKVVAMSNTYTFYGQHFST
jgi:hypothetical protein